MAIEMSEREDETVSSTAIGWLVLLESGQASADDRKRFSLWLTADPAHAAAYREAADFWAGLDTLSPQDVRDLDRYLVDDTPIVSGTNRTFWQKLPAIAAIMLLITGTNFWLTLIWHPQGDYHTATGEQRTVALADGSVLQLSTNTAVSVTFGQDSRHLILHRGEAFFTVAPDATRPFEVTAGKGAIRALGTAFNVRTDLDHVTVTVSEHSIRIKTPGEPSAEVHAGERIRYDADGRMGQIESADLLRALAWQRHRLVFENQPLTEVLEELARYRSGWIVLRDPELRALSVTGVFDTEHPDHILTAIEESLPIRPVKLTNQFILLYRGQTKTR
jgi:transmembrane sensor